MSRNRWIKVLCGLGLFRPIAAWLLPLPHGTSLAAGAAMRARVSRVAHSTLMKAAEEDSAEDGGRADLAAMKQGFGRSMDGRLIMEYVQVCCCRARRHTDSRCLRIRARSHGLARHRLAFGIASRSSYTSILPAALPL